MKNSPSCNCCTAGPSDCCSGTTPTAITIEITDVFGPCDFWNSTWVLAQVDTCMWQYSGTVPGIGLVLVTLQYYQNGPDLRLRIQGDADICAHGWCVDIVTSTACCLLVGTVLEMLADACGGNPCICQSITSASEVEITGVTGC